MWSKGTERTKATPPLLNPNCAHHKDRTPREDLPTDAYGFPIRKPFKIHAGRSVSRGLGSAKDLFRGTVRDRPTL